MKYVYHQKPNNLQGDFLFPLNQMEKVLPAIYKEAVQKYKGRESLMEEMLPILNCRWNDVVHLAPIDPKIVYKNLIELGFNPDETEQWFKIPVSKLPAAETVVFKYDHEDGELTKDQVVQFSHEAYEELPALPKTAFDWYRSCAEQKRRPLLFHRVPHILTVLPIDISACELICWSDA